jgi:PAS domain S-box-containing protein
MSFASAAQRSLRSEDFVASRRVSRLLRQSLLGMLAMLLGSLPLAMLTPAIQLSRAALLTAYALGTAGVCLALSLRSHQQRAAVYLATLGLLVISLASLLNTGLRYSGSALVVLVAPILLLGIQHRRRGVLAATALALAAVALATSLELHRVQPPGSGSLSEFAAMLLLRAAFASLSLGGIGFLIDRFMAILSEREEFLADVLTNIETAVLVYDIDERGHSYVAAMNAACQDLLDRSAAGMVGRSRTDLLSALAAQQSIAKPILDPGPLEVARIKQVTRNELRLRVGTSEREFWMVAAPQLNEAGETIRLVVSGTDISAYRQAERQLRFQADVLASIHDAVIAIDRGGLITYMNRAAERLYQQPAAACLGTSLSGLSGAEFARAVLASAHEPEESSPVGSGQFCRPDSVQVPVEFTVSTLRGEGDETAGTLAVIRDVTERRQLQAQLVQAQKQDALGRLAGGVAHDFNNLLVVIRGGAEFVHADLPTDHPSQPDLLEVMRAADRAAGLVRQLLAFARRQPPSPRSVNLDQVLHDLTYMLRRLIREEIELYIDIEKELWCVQIDVAQLEQVIVNLLVNARDAIAASGRITLSARNTPVAAPEARTLGVTPGEYVVLRVRDNGTGMNAETMKNIFEPFFSTKATGAGTGLGLAVCYGIIKQLGGGIIAESSPGQGAEFVIALPRSLIPAGSPSEPGNFELPRGTETILLVEDDQAVRELAGRVLRTQGYRVYEAGDGASALARAAELGAERIDLLFSDVILPQMRGQELAQCLLASRPGMAVLLASGYGDSGMSPVGAGEGVRAFLAKPYGPAALVQRVREVLDAAQHARETPTDDSADPD